MKMRRIGAAYEIDRVDATVLLMADALEDPLGPGALDPHGDARIFRLEGLAQLFRYVELERGGERELALPARGLDQDRSHRRGFRRRGLERLPENRARGRGGRGFQHVTPGQLHGELPCAAPL